MISMLLDFRALRTLEYIYIRARLVVWDVQCQLDGLYGRVVLGFLSDNANLLSF